MPDEVSTPSERPPFDFQLNGPMFNPFDWYWVAEDGRAYSSGRQAIIDVEDPTLAAWVNAGYVPTGWPRDIDGNQTNAALQDVLTPLGKSI